MQNSPTFIVTTETDVQYLHGISRDAPSHSGMLHKAVELHARSRASQESDLKGSECVTAE